MSIMFKLYSMTLEDPLNHSECYRMRHDVGFSRWRAGGELFFMPQQMEVQWGGGFLVNIMYSMVVSGSPKRW